MIASGNEGFGLGVRYEVGTLEAWVAIGKLPAHHGLYPQGAAWPPAAVLHAPSVQRGAVRGWDGLGGGVVLLLIDRIPSLRWCGARVVALETAYWVVGDPDWAVRTTMQLSCGAWAVAQAMVGVHMADQAATPQQCGAWGDAQGTAGCCRRLPLPGMRCD